MKFLNKVVMVSGAGRGIGRETAEYFYKNGAFLALNVRADSAYYSKWDKKRYILCQFDVRDHKRLITFVKKAIKAFKKIDILINNAGIDQPRGILTMNYEHLHNIMNVNFYSVVLLTKEVCQYMVKAGYGKIINISSIAGKEGTINHIAYTASKHAILGFNKCLARELIDYNINVNAVCPGLIQTDMLKNFFTDLSEQTGKPKKWLLNAMLNNVPLKKIGKAIDVANLIGFLVSDESSNIVGQSFNTDGGYLQW